MLTLVPDAQTDARRDGRTDWKTKTKYPSTYFVCWEYKKAQRVIPMQFILVLVIIIDHVLTLLSEWLYILVEGTQQKDEQFQSKQLFQLQIKYQLYLKVFYSSGDQCHDDLLAAKLIRQPYQGGNQSVPHNHTDSSWMPPCLYPQCKLVSRQYQQTNIENCNKQSRSFGFMKSSMILQAIYPL